MNFLDCTSFAFCSALFCAIYYFYNCLSLFARLFFHSTLSSQCCRYGLEPPVDSLIYYPRLYQAFAVGVFCRLQLKVSSNIWAVLLVRRLADWPWQRVSPWELRSLTLINWGLSSNWPTLTNIIHQPLIMARIEKWSWALSVELQLRYSIL